MNINGKEMSEPEIRAYINDVKKKLLKHGTGGMKNDR